MKITMCVIVENAQRQIYSCKKGETLKVSNLNFCLKELEKNMNSKLEEKNQTAEINEIKYKQTIEKNKTQS